jgi:hypothetical protein
MDTNPALAFFTGRRQSPVIRDCGVVLVSSAFGSNLLKNSAVLARIFTGFFDSAHRFIPPDCRQGLPYPILSKEQNRNTASMPEFILT